MLNYAVNDSSTCAFEYSYCLTEKEKLKVGEYSKT